MLTEKEKKMRLIDADELQMKLRSWDWQDLYLPVHFDELIKEMPTIRFVVINVNGERIAMPVGWLEKKEVENETD